MTVRAKFKVSHLKDNDGSVTVSMNPVYSDDPNSENRRFWNATPAGSIEMTINNPAAFNQFTEGQEYYVDFSPAVNEQAIAA